MTEKLLQFIWQFGYFNKSELATESGEELQIIFPGLLNTQQGPDFSNAKIRIGSTVWAGTVELHLLTSDWQKHKHGQDKNYGNVILHVVWRHDQKANRVPVLELKNRVPKILLHRYEELMHSVAFIPCEKSVAAVKEIVWKSWKERLLAERLIRKSAFVENFLKQNNFHWEEAFWWLLARNFGVNVNADAFEKMARSIPLPVLAKHKNQIHQLEALLFGQAGLLEKTFREDYPAMLRKEYQFLKKKYSLQNIHEPLHFLRMRPGNFPTIRLAQLAMLIHGSAHLFSKIKEAQKAAEVRTWFDVATSDYWHHHYRFNKPSAYRKKHLGPAMADNIIINTVVPVLFAYGNYHNEAKYKEKALFWLEQTAAESNAITRGFQKSGVENRSAYDSQALIELKNEYCSRKRCLECAVGNAILKS